VLKGVEKEGMKREDGGRGGTLADLDAHGGGGRGTAPLPTLGTLGPKFPSIAISDVPLVASLAHPTHFPLPSPTPQNRGQLHPALYSAPDYFLCPRLEIVAVSTVASVSGRVASARNVE
jgi:hypothetical protein